MFQENDMVEFINKIINNEDSDNEIIKRNVSQFRDYLELTKICSSSSLERISQIVECMDEILSLKNKLGSCDISLLISGTLNSQKNKVLDKRIAARRSVDKYVEKHYHHYGQVSSSNNYSYTDNCSGGNFTYRSC